MLTVHCAVVTIIRIKMKILIRNVRLKLQKRRTLNYVALSVGFSFMCLMYLSSSFSSTIIQSLTIHFFTQSSIFSQLNSEQFQIYLHGLNRVGKSRSVLQAFKEIEAIPDLQSDTKSGIVDELRKLEQEIRVTAERHPNVNTPSWHKFSSISTVRQIAPTINIATIACGAKSKVQAMVMIKSAVLFSQDANVHVIVFSDNSTILSLGQSLLELKWTVNQLGWDFTFELVQEWFPTQESGHGEAWREMWQPCATQRLFFPSLLPHVDSLIYLDADTIVLSNLTELWLNFETNMKSHEILAAMTPNTEYPAWGHYNLKSKVPFYGFGGLNAGVALMNLTRMREFKIQDLSIQTYNKYVDYIILADQDIYNIIFHFHPEKLSLLDCSYNFNWVHCGGGPEMQCENNKDPGPICFCYGILASGVKIVHGNMGTFFFDYPFLMELYQRFLHLNLLTNSTRGLIENLKMHFKTLDTPCFFLTAETLFINAENYLENIYS